MRGTCHVMHTSLAAELQLILEAHLTRRVAWRDEAEGACGADVGRLTAGLAYGQVGVWKDVDAFVDLLVIPV